MKSRHEDACEGVDVPFCALSRRVLKKQNRPCPLKTWARRSDSIQARRTKVTKVAPRARYTHELEQEAVRLVWGRRSIASAASTLRAGDQAPVNWLRAHRAGRRTGA
jgi:hypothetical protein